MLHNTRSSINQQAKLTQLIWFDCHTTLLTFFRLDHTFSMVASP